MPSSTVSNKIKAERVQRKIKAERVQAKVKRMRGWEFDKKKNCITRTYLFPTYLAGIRFVTYVAEIAEALNHHPDLEVGYRKVVVNITTHDAGGVTEKDFDLAEMIDAR